jgi:uncharacterized protein
MLISIQQLKKTPAQPVTFAFTVSAEALDLPEEDAQPVETVDVVLRATYHNGVVLLQGEMRTTVILECSRCLNRCAAPLETGFEEQVPAEDMLTLEVSDMIREHYFAMLPAKPLCHPSCRGLCAQCGVNRNEEQCDCQTAHEDHRLSVLSKLLS